MDCDLVSDIDDAVINLFPASVDGLIGTYLRRFKFIPFGEHAIALK